MPINKYIYAVVLLVILGAWFSDFRIPTPPKSIGAFQEPTRIVTNIGDSGVNRYDWQVGGKCNIEYINGTLFDSNFYAVEREGALILTGWTLDEKKERIPDSVIIRFKNIESEKEFFANARVGIKRPDVQAYFKLPAHLVTSGFRLITYLQDIALGEYDLSLLTIYPDGAYICNNGRKIYVR